MKSLILQTKRLLEVKIVRLTLHVVFFNSLTQNGVEFVVLPIFLREIMRLFC